jgi:hypothetical protein
MRRDPPSLALLDDMKRGLGADVLARCPSLSRHLASKGVESGREAAARIGDRPLPDGLYAADIMNLSLPVLSADGGSALIATGVVSGPESGVGVIYHLRRDKSGRWAVVDWTGTWIA